jgi:uncharacterized protein
VRRLLFSPALLILLLPGYTAWRLISAFSTGPTTLWVVAAILVGALTVPLARTRFKRGERAADLLSFVSMTLMGSLSTLFVLTLLRDLALLVLRLTLGAGVVAEWLQFSAILVLGLTVAITALGMAAARRRPRVVSVDIPVNGLPESLRGFSIAQISDVHVGPTIKKGFVTGVVERVNALKADLIAVTGDLVDGSVANLASHTAPLSNLSARHGAFFVTGNHEYYSGEAAWTRELRRLGLTVLKNEHVVLNHDGASLILAGVTDFSAHHFDPAQKSDPGAALAGAPPHAGAKILLAHQPSTATAAAQAGFDVQISGHTHGGQFWPWNFFVKYFQPFTHGLNRLKNLRIYVSRGTGYWGPPNRFGVPSEITHIRLVPAPLS